MNERKKSIIKQGSKRRTQHEKLKDALAKKPTASYFNSVGISPSQLNQLSAIPEQKQKFLKERLITNSSRSRKRVFRHPVVTIPTDMSMNMEAPTFDGKSSEWPTPLWFRSTAKADVSVIIPLYKSHDVIVDLIRSLPLENEGLKVEFIFVDDQCPTNSRDAVMRAWENRKGDVKSPVGKIIYNSKNKGYGGACNAGASFASGDYLIFLNADTKATPGWVKPMIDLFKDKKVGLVGNMHLKEGGGWDGTIDSAGSEWKWNDMSFVHIARHCYQKQGIQSPFRPESAPKDLMIVGEREMVTGCCFAIPAELYKYIGGFNPNYRIGYWEDSEICLNVRELGYKILYQPKSVIYHKLGHTHSGGHKYFGTNRQFFMNKWVKSHRLDDLLLSEARPKTQDPVRKILVKRTSAHGDALVAAGVCAGLKKKYPDADILFSTMFKEVIFENPYIDRFVELADVSKTQFDVFYNLDLCYEWRPNVNILSCYAEAVGVKPEDCKVWITPQPAKLDLPDEYVVIHPGKTDWVGRDWPHENFVQIAQRLLDAGEKVVCIGKYTEGDIPCTMDVRNGTNIAQLAWVINKAKAFIGIDSMPMHVAQALDVPGVSFFGSILPELRIYSKNMKGISAKGLYCLGCHHRKPAPSTVTKHCETGTHDCIKNVSVEEMWLEVQQLLSPRLSLL